MLKITRSHDVRMFNIVILIPGKYSFYSETGPRIPHFSLVNLMQYQLALFAFVLWYEIAAKTRRIKMAIHKSLAIWIPI